MECTGRDAMKFYFGVYFECINVRLGKLQVRYLKQLRTKNNHYQIMYNFYLKYIGQQLKSEIINSKLKTNHYEMNNI